MLALERVESVPDFSSSRRKSCQRVVDVMEVSGILAAMEAGAAQSPIHAEEESSYIRCDRQVVETDAGRVWSDDVGSRGRSSAGPAEFFERSYAQFRQKLYTFQHECVLCRYLFFIILVRR